MLFIEFGENCTINCSLYYTKARNSDNVPRAANRDGWFSRVRLRVASLFYASSSHLTIFFEDDSSSFLERSGNCGPGIMHQSLEVCILIELIMPRAEIRIGGRGNQLRNDSIDKNSASRPLFNASRSTRSQKSLSPLAPRTSRSAVFPIQFQVAHSMSLGYKGYYYCGVGVFVYFTVVIMAYRHI